MVICLKIILMHLLKNHILWGSASELMKAQKSFTEMLEIFMRDLNWNYLNWIYEAMMIY